jgi:hypothetical protein
MRGQELSEERDAVLEQIARLVSEAVEWGAENSRDCLMQEPRRFEFLSYSNAG